MLRKSLLCAALMLTACGQNSTEGDAFREGLPSQETVEMKAPAKAGQGLQVDAQAKGGQSDTYAWTRGATVVVNGGTAAVLTLLEKITEHPASSVHGDTAVWGPHTEALARNTWKLTVKKTGDNTYSYTVSAKAKDAADSAFVDVITGTHTAAVNEADEPMKGFGQGEFTLDWETAQTLPEHDANVGKMTVKYARLDATSAITVDAAFDDVKDGDDASKRVDAKYGYKAVPGQGGEFDFKLIQDWYKPAGSTALETLTIKSRWLETGAGRSDVRLSGGDFQSDTAEASECWDTTFASRFLYASYALPKVRYGTEATDCAFTTRLDSSL